MAMSKQEQAVLIIKGLLSEAEPAIREKVYAAADKLRAVVAEYGDEGKVAMAMVVGEFEEFKR